jgi:hypothetical protein
MYWRSADLSASSPAVPFQAEISDARDQSVTYNMTGVGR